MTSNILSAHSISYQAMNDQSRGYRHPFIFGIHYLGGVGDTPRTLVDLALSQLSAEARRSPDWWKHYKSDGFRNKWTAIGLQRVWKVQTPSSCEDIKLSSKQVNYVLDELGGYAILRDEKGQCQVSSFDRLWEADFLIDASTAALLHERLLMLKPSSTVDEDSVTTNLIDPALYPLEYNRTLVSHLNGRKYWPIRPPLATDIYTISPDFSLLPSDVFISATGSVKFLSYINSLHPQIHQETYILLQDLLSGFIPLLEHTLTDLHRNNPLVQRIVDSCRYTIWDEPEAPEHSDDEESWVNYEREMREWALNRPINLPDVPPMGYRGGLEKRRHTVKLRNRVVQVNVKAVDIRLKPGGPEFLGSPWHVEGMRAERIVACGFHCLSISNITSTSLQFRMAVTYPRGFNVGDNGATIRTWGFRDGDPCHQYIGDVPIRRGLSLAFPNIYQHRQTSFRLTDPLQEGHLTAIWFFLVDPEISPVVSTSIVAPQQKEWIYKAVDEHIDKRLPNEVVEKIMDAVEGLMTREEATTNREQLLEGRKIFTQASNRYHFCIPFDVWNGPESSS